MKLVSLNIEGNKHLHQRVLPFLQQEQPDVVCLQEVYEVDLPEIEQALGMSSYFAPQSNVLDENPHLPARGIFGVAQFTAWPVVEQKTDYYVGSVKNIPRFFENEEPNAQNRALLWQLVVDPATQQQFSVATTHFTWSPNGSFTDEQLRDYEQLLNILKQFDQLILCGDFNSPRNVPGYNVYHRLAELYQDAIPPQYTTSVDSAFHKSGKQIELLVDFLMVSDAYRAEGVRIVDGVSDHMAVVGEVQHA